MQAANFYFEIGSNRNLKKSSRYFRRLYFCWLTDKFVLIPQKY